MKKPTTIRPLETPWSDQALTDCPLSEYPRPQLVRDNWMCLNGMWQYTIRPDKAFPNHWDGEIRVPYSPESLLSGVQRTVQITDTLWYKRSFTLKKPENGRRVLLHFGAVDQLCKVWVNDKVAGRHDGGYHPFTLDITEFVNDGENELLVRVRDLCDTGDEAYSKQRIDRGGIWYTGQSGIWQTVWLEETPACYIDHLRISPRCRHSEVKVTVSMVGENVPCHGRVLKDGVVISEADAVDGILHIPMVDYHMWSPDDPFLYDLEITAGEDTVRSYFGMRIFGFKREKHGRKVLTLNGRPIFHHGLLDQGYWSDGLYTPPSDEAMIWEIKQLKELGFNMLRKHIKIEPLRWYYHCDRLGMLVWQDFPSGGGPYHPMMIQVLPWLGLMIKDKHYKLFGRQNDKGRANCQRDAKRTVELLYNCVSLCCWVPFNEGWGQFDAIAMADFVRTMDHSRYIDHASGWHDQGAGNFQSSHIYYKSFRPKPDKNDRVMALTEYGGYSLSCPGHMSSDELFGYKGFQTREELNHAVEDLYDREVIPAIEHGLAADVYTQVSDVEDEINGLFTYDRYVVKLDNETGKRIASKIKRAFEDTQEKFEASKG